MNKLYLYIILQYSTYKLRIQLDIYNIWGFMMLYEIDGYQWDLD